VVASAAMKRLGRRLPVWAVLLVAAHAWGSAPVLTGLYRVGNLGIVDFSIQEGRVIGKLKLASGCPVASDVQVVTGNFEGTVFVGEVLLCQDGPSCAEKKYPVLGVAHDDSVVATVKLDTGCHSSALNDRQLAIVPASIDEKRKVLDGVSGSAAAVAAKNTSKKTAEEQATEAFEAGQQALEKGDYSAAREAFGRAVAYDDAKWYLHFGLGVARVHLADPTGAIESLERALALAVRSKTDASMLSQIHYNLACAHTALGHKKEAIASLRTMSRLPPNPEIVDRIDSDTDLAGLRAEPEFRKVVAELRVAREKTRKPK
jgi:hypothetical protein